ncbi:hypothetical protein [Vallitalea okinawensis]|uniref:hypothetical protein n=1 Tax=Vallitalea okinawensis TaxID=2078660 RepID=UPI00130080D3|nr:hypothetical protein [Vallitalea okinawensis]
MPYDVESLKQMTKDFINYVEELKKKGIITNEQYELLTENKIAFLENNTYLK